MIPFKVKYLKHLIIILLGAFLFSVPCFAGAVTLSVDPSSDLHLFGKAGDFIQLPATTGFANQLKCSHTQAEAYYIKIKASGDLTSGSDTIPLSSVYFMCTYVNYYNGISTPGSGTTFPNFHTYVPFSTSYTDVYLTTTAEASAGEVQPQFKYAVAIPSAQRPGTYQGIITYQAICAITPIHVNTGSVNIYVHVLPMLQLLIDRGTIDFENMLPGQEKENVPVEGILVTTKTNTGNPWFLKISNDSPLTSGPDVIPNNNFIWYGWTDGKGRWSGTGEDPLSVTPKLVYTSDASEGNNLPDGTVNHLKFKLKIPNKQKTGKYLSTVRLTVTE